MLNSFTYYPNEILSKAKRELDKRYRKRTIKKQNEILKKQYEDRINSLSVTDIPTDLSPDIQDKAPGVPF
jgi:hypothetical protein